MADIHGWKHYNKEEDPGRKLRRRIVGYVESIIQDWIESESNRISLIGETSENEMDVILEQAKAKRKGLIEILDEGNLR